MVLYNLYRFIQRFIRRVNLYKMYKNPIGFIHLYTAKSEERCSGEN